MYHDVGYHGGNDCDRRFVVQIFGLLMMVVMEDGGSR